MNRHSFHSINLTFHFLHQTTDMRFFPHNFFLFLALSFSTFFAVHAENNGSPDKSNVFKVSSIRLLNKPDISIFSERVKLSVEGDYCRIKVAYEFWNNAEKEIDIEAGLPIYFTSNNGNDDVFEWNPEYVKNFKVTLEDGTPVETVDKIDDQIWNDSLVASGQKTPVRTKRKMFTFKFKVPQVTSKTLNVEYVVKSCFKDIKGPKNFFPKYGVRLLQYDFTPALQWGKGTIRDFSLVIDCGDIPKDFIHATGVGFNSIAWQDGLYMMNQTDMPINKFSILHMEYDYNVAAFNEFLNVFRTPSDRVLKTRISSQADVYSGPENLYDGNFGSIWAEGTSHQGVGEYIDVMLEDYPLCGIAIINGFAKTEDDYTENGRLAKVKIEREFINANNCLQTDVTIKEIPYASYRKVNATNFSKSIVILADYGDTKVRTRKVRVTILETHPGSRFDKTSISELYFIGNE